MNRWTRQASIRERSSKRRKIDPESVLDDSSDVVMQDSSDLTDGCDSQSTPPSFFHSLFDDPPTTPQSSKFLEYFQNLSLPSLPCYEFFSVPVQREVDDTFWGVATCDEVARDLDVGADSVFRHSAVRYSGIYSIGRHVPPPFRLLQPLTLPEKFTTYVNLMKDAESDKPTRTVFHDQRYLDENFPVRPSSYALRDYITNDPENFIFIKVLRELEENYFISFERVTEILREHERNSKCGRWIRETFLGQLGRKSLRPFEFRKVQIGRKDWYLYEKHPKLTDKANDRMITELVKNGRASADDRIGFDLRVGHVWAHLIPTEEAMDLGDDFSEGEGEGGEVQSRSRADLEEGLMLDDGETAASIPNPVDAELESVQFIAQNDLGRDSLSARAYHYATAPPRDYGVDFTVDDGLEVVDEIRCISRFLVQERELDTYNLARMRTLVANEFRAKRIGPRTVAYPDVIKRASAIHRTHMSSTQFERSMSSLREFPSARTANKSLSEVQYEMGSPWLRHASQRCQAVRKVILEAKMKADNFRTLTSILLDGVDVNMMMSVDYPCGIWEGTTLGPRFIGNFDQDEGSLVGLNEKALFGKALASMSMQQGLMSPGPVLFCPNEGTAEYLAVVNEIRGQLGGEIDHICHDYHGSSRSQLSAEIADTVCRVHTGKNQSSYLRCDNKEFPTKVYPLPRTRVMTKVQLSTVNSHKAQLETSGTFRAKVDLPVPGRNSLKVVLDIYRLVPAPDPQQQGGWSKICTVETVPMKPRQRKAKPPKVIRFEPNGRTGDRLFYSANADGKVRLLWLGQANRAETFGFVLKRGVPFLQFDVEKAEMDYFNSETYHDLWKKYPELRSMVCRAALQKKIDRQNEHVVRQMCTEEVLTFLRSLGDEVSPGLLDYLENMNRVYHSIFRKDQTLEGDILELEKVIAWVDPWLEFLEGSLGAEVTFDRNKKDEFVLGFKKASRNNFRSAMSVTQEFFDIQKINLKGERKILEIMARKSAAEGIEYRFDLHLLCTNRIEGLFGECRAHSPTFNCSVFRRIWWRLCERKAAELAYNKFTNVRAAKQYYLAHRALEKGLDPDVYRSVQKQLHEAYLENFGRKEGESTMERKKFTRAQHKRLRRKANEVNMKVKQIRMYHKLSTLNQKIMLQDNVDD